MINLLRPKMVKATGSSITANRRVPGILTYGRGITFGITFIILVAGFQNLNAQQTPFSRGVNLTNWFQTGSAGQIQFTKYTKQDFENIKSLGCDVIRLPINLHYMTDGEPDYILDPLFLGFLDEVVSWAEELDIHLILDNHTFDVSSDTDPAVGNILEKVWKQMALHYRDGYSKLYYEILNEPHGITDQKWNVIQQAVVAVIRTADTTHTIVIGGAGWNSYNNLAPTPVYTDTNLIYTFHFYDPFLFTHQGASWVEPSMVPLAGVPFPYDPDSMPLLPSSLVGTWVGSAFNDYHNVGNAQKVKEWLDIAISFKGGRHVPIFCGELGVFIPNSDNQDRIAWYKLVTNYLEENEVAWTSWDYQGGFGIFEEGGNGLFEHDLNIPLLEAMGLNTPEQTEYEMKPDTSGVFIYSDYIESGIIGAYWGQGSLDYYSTDSPNNGKRCMRWEGPGQYNTIVFDFTPDKDLSELEENGYAFDFMVRGYVPGTRFDARFIDTKTGDSDHPWRMTATINQTRMTMDGKWYHVRIPLADFMETGSWDNGAWLNPEGKFDWKAIDRFEIVSEYGGLENAGFWFDNIHITDLDTAKINDYSVFSDTIVLFDTIVLTNYLVLIDSLVDIDTIVDIDSIVLTEIIIYTDTIRMIDSIMIIDTVTFFNTVRLADTISFSDTLRFVDTIRLADTLNVTESVSQITGNDDIRIYPNPVGPYLTILSRLPDRLTMGLYDLSGRLLGGHSFTGQAELVTGDLPEGVYILKVSDNRGNSWQFKLLKQ